MESMFIIQGQLDFEWHNSRFERRNIVIATLTRNVEAEF